MRSSPRRRSRFDSNPGWIWWRGRNETVKCVSVQHDTGGGFYLAIDIAARGCEFEARIRKCQLGDYTLLPKGADDGRLESTWR
jgi:hypothetical protein